MKEYFQVGDLRFCVACEKSNIFPAHFLAFRVEQTDASYMYEIRITDTLPQPRGTLVTGWPDLKIFATDVGEERLIGVKGSEEPYAFYRETASDRAEIYYRASWMNMITVDTIFVSLLALERRMIALGGLVLHCSYVRCQGEAILFSAPSETGKTTQANLWKQYRGSEIINGDRALLQEVNGRWMAGGWPVCGSSEECRREQTPVRAIVMLSQGKENTVSPLRPALAFSQLYGQITVNRWNREANRKAMDLLERLLASVPVYHLNCTISEEAVQCLESALNLQTMSFK